MENRHAVHPTQAATMDTAELRANFLVTDLFQPGRVTLVHSHEDRVVLGGAAPVDGPVVLPAPPELRCEYFLERRELGIVVIRGQGAVSADGQAYQLPKGGCLYLGRGIRAVEFDSDPADPALFYLFSAPAHTSHPAAMMLPGQADVRELGDQEHANRRSLHRFIHPDGIRSCQIVMGWTRLHPGSMWNTMPAHTHDRRMEAYLYFDVPEDARVLHLMGRPGQTRHLVVANHQAVISPSWSIHSGVGTQAYTFVWAMAGENQAFDDMDHCPVETLG